MADPQQIPTANVILTTEYSVINYYASQNSLATPPKNVGGQSFVFAQDNISNILSFVHKTMPGSDGAGDSHSFVMDFVDPENICSAWTWVPDWSYCPQCLDYTEIYSTTVSEQLNSLCMEMGATADGTPIDEL